MQNEFSWSISRDVLFNRCLRAYYYHYYGSWNGWRPDAHPQVKELYVMKNLRSIRAWIGGVVHEVVEAVIRRMSEATQLAEDQAIRITRERARRDWQVSRTGQYRARPNRRCGLQEHYYALPITDESLEQALATMEACVRRFFGTGPYNRMLEAGPEMIIEFERLSNMYVSGCKVWIGPDLVARDPDDGIVVVDWKTGVSAPTEQTQLQLAVYGLYVVQTYHSAPEELSGLEVSLRTGEECLYGLDSLTLERARRYIENSANRMQRILDDREQNVASIHQFPMTEDLDSCASCRFRRACGRE